MSEPSSATVSFNPRARAGRDSKAVREPAAWTVFQSTRPRGARHELNYAVDHGSMFQSTRPRGARHPAAHIGVVRVPVSIHAPARGATRRSPPPAPCHRRFNPRARAGRDSQHQPCAKHRPCFNPRARAGRDQHGGELGLGELRFQSTRPRGARPRHSRLSDRMRTGFNPRARAGRDVIVLSSCSVTSCFNPRARAGRDGDQGDFPGNEDNVSIHAPARGATKVDAAGLIHVQFQSTRPRGARLRGKQGQHHHCSFNPRARAGRDTIRGVERGDQ